MCENNSSENSFYFKVDDTLDEDYSNLRKELACQLTLVHNELNTIKLIITLLLIYIICYRKNC